MKGGGVPKKEGKFICGSGRKGKIQSLNKGDMGSVGEVNSEGGLFAFHPVIEGGMKENEST